MKDSELQFDRTCHVIYSKACNLARNFFRAGKDVTLLARGPWGESIRKNGLRIKDKFSLRTSVSRIPVTAELKPTDGYDVIFVVVRYTQIPSVAEALRASSAKHIVFVGNNPRAEETAAYPAWQALEQETGNYLSGLAQ